MSTESATSSCCGEVNVSPKERIVCGLLSGVLLARALRGQHGAFSLLAAGALAFRALSGHCIGYSALGLKTSGLK
jgi:hypothetical protein